MWRFARSAIALAATLALHHLPTLGFQHARIPSTRQGVSAVLFAGKGFGKEDGVQERPRKDSRDYVSTTASGETVYLPMSKNEISTWLSHIPIYAVTDPDGNARTLQLGGKSVLYFFLSPVMAEAFMKQVVEIQSQSGDSPADLTVSGLFLGSMWFEGFDAESKQEGTEYRLVPDPRDLITARTLYDGTEDGEEEATESEDLFVQPYNEVPLFGVNTVPSGGKNKNVVNFLNQMVSSNYMFFSAQNMFNVMDNLKKETKDMETEDELWSLHEIVEQMKSESSVDFRNTVLMAPSPLADGPIPDAVLANQLSDASSFTSQEFFATLFEE